MRYVLKKTEYRKEEIVQQGHSFLLGNGHLGYRGTYEENTKEDHVGLNLAGVYDQYKDLWRESINLPNPFYIVVHRGEKEISLKAEKPLKHCVELDLEKALFERKDEWREGTVSSKRFVSSADDEFLGEEYRFTANESGTYSLTYGIDLDVYEINGPHYVEKEVREENGGLLFRGLTNEKKEVYLFASYELNGGERIGSVRRGGVFRSSLSLKKGETAVLTVRALVLENKNGFEEKAKRVLSVPFKTLYGEHARCFQQKWDESNVVLKGKNEDAFALSYSIYQLLILGDRKRTRSIPARGGSGQVYKGAVFWDTEIFLLPFFLNTDWTVARNLILYRIRTLGGAVKKAEEYGYKGAFYAWESQEDGRDACSKYNVTDPETGQKVRTYFNEKQIHISADIPYAIGRYIEETKDVSILDEGAYEVLKQCALFFTSYAKLEEDGLYHLDDVIGPDEYHERVDDNAFTNYMAKRAIELAVRYLSGKEEEKDFCAFLKDFLSRLYLPRPDKNGVIEQFRGYFQKEDVSVETVRSRLLHPQDYWGGKKGVATPTQVIKQADVVAMLVLLGDEFPLDVKKANYEYYYPRTEHGSSLSASMYSLLGLEVGEKEKAYDFFRKSASIDLVGASKNYAGGIYIGGTHPASSGGAYLDAVSGFAGMSKKDGKVTFSPRLPDEVESLEIPYVELGRRKRATITRDGKVLYKEEKI